MTIFVKTDFSRKSRRKHIGKKGGKGLTKTAKKEVKSIVKAKFESKTYHVTSQGTEIFNTSTFATAIALTSGLPQGDNSQNRVGQQIEPTSLTFAYSLYNKYIVSRPLKPSPVRIVIWQWLNDTRDTGGVTINPLVENIFDALVQVGTVLPFMSNMSRMYTIEGRDNFHILYDKVHNLDPVTSLGVITTKIVIPLHKDIRYNGADPTGHNQIFMGCFGVHETLEDDNYSLTYYSRLRYTDA